MNIPIFIFMILGSTLAEAWPWQKDKVNILAIGDSQTGTPGKKSYFGNFLQRCLSDNKEKFVTYGRGGTRPIHWIDNSDMDIVTTIQRDPKNEEKNIGWGLMVPEYKRRIDPMLAKHSPKKMLVFFGDNLLLHPEEYVSNQSRKIVDIIRAHGIAEKNCFFLTPTYEMEVLEKRNMPGKNFENTKTVIDYIKKAVTHKCQVIDGLELMKDSSLLLENKLFKRQQSNGDDDCFGESSNDNIHICGDVARDLADKVCQMLI